MIFASFLCLSLSHTIILECYCGTTTPEPTKSTVESIDISFEKDMGRFEILLNKLTNETNIMEKYIAKATILERVRNLLLRTLKAESYAKNLLSKGINEYEMEYYRRIIVNYICSCTIRNVIELYPVRYHLSPDGEKWRQNEVHEKIRKLLDERKAITDERIKKLKHVINILTPKNGDADVKKAWKLLKNIKYGLPKVISNLPTESSYNSWTINAYESNTSTLGINLAKLYEASDVETANNVYNEQKKFWCSKGIRNINKTELDIFLCSIPFENILTLKCMENQWLTNKDEINYAVDIVKTGQFANPKRSKYYDECLWIIYTVEHMHIARLRQLINQRWSSMDRASQYNFYCYQYAHIYDVVSVVSMRGQRILPSPKCEPTEEDYESFVNQLFRKDIDLCFVAKTLYISPDLLPYSTESPKN